MKIVFLSHTPRNTIFKVGSVHLSREFAQMGHQVLYIPSAISLFHILNIAGLRDEDYRNSLKSRLLSLSPYKDADGVLNVTPFVLTPFNRGIFDNPKIAFRQWFTFNQVHRQIKKIGFDEADLVIQDKPGLYFLHKFIEADTWIYRATDDYSQMPGGPGKEALQKVEKEVCRYSDQVIVTSEPLKTLFEDRYNVKATVFRNGVDVAHFGTPQEQPPEYESLDGPIILYVGSLDDRFDLELLQKTASKNKHCHFLVVGPGGREAITADQSNIIPLGPRPYEQVPAYMQHADVGILPLKMTEANHARSPMKIYEYGICGLPVVSTPLQELKSRAEKFIAFGKTADQFSEQINDCLAQKHQLSEIAKQHSKLHSWNKIANELLAFAVNCSKKQV